MSRRPSLGRVRENRTYGLKGGRGNGPASTPRPGLPMGTVRIRNPIAADPSVIGVDDLLQRRAAALAVLVGHRLPRHEDSAADRTLSGLMATLRARVSELLESDVEWLPHVGRRGRTQLRCRRIVLALASGSRAPRWARRSRVDRALLDALGALELEINRLDHAQRVEIARLETDIRSIRRSLALDKRARLHVTA